MSTLWHQPCEEAWSTGFEEIEGNRMSKIHWCKNCWMPSTRPRITFSERGWCNACEWAEEKKSIDWEARQKYFGQICDRFRGNGREPDCIVPWSGGKDSIYVAYKMRDEFGMTPLLMCVVPHLETEIGRWNRLNTCKDFQKLFINLKEDKYRSLARKYFIEKGRPKHPWEAAISAVVINQAIKLGIPFVIYGEEGEMEYGGATREKDRWMKPVDKEYLMTYYWQNDLDWEIPDEKDFERLFFTQWSRFENWSPTAHWTFAKEKGMRDNPVRSVGTLWRGSQLSDKLQDLHMYLAFLKFGFGRCTADACIRIREGLLDRDEALEIIEHYDGEFPNVYLKEYLDYFDMSYDEFCDVLKKHADKEILEQATIKGAQHIWSLKEWVLNFRRKGTVCESVSPDRFKF